MSIYIKYSTYSGAIHKQPIAWWSYLGRAGSYTAVSSGDCGSIICADCRANNWNDDGYSINTYECGCCGAYVAVQPLNLKG